jgi:hypothetical protein
MKIRKISYWSENIKRSCGLSVVKSADITNYSSLVNESSLHFWLGNLR